MLSINLDHHARDLKHGELARELELELKQELERELAPSVSNIILDKFAPTSLKALNEMTLDDRVDTKFVLPKKLLRGIVEYLSHHYAILTVDNENIFTYENIYFDTPDRLFYHSHHNGKLNRQKLRLRRYKESDLCVLETKFKTNKSRTIKQRIQIEENNQQDIINFLNEQIDPTTGSLSPKLFNSYQRMTFTHLQKREKVTIDFDLGFESPDNSLQYQINDYFVVEAKAKVDRSEFSQYCKENGIRKNRFSKYCMGTCFTNDQVKKNNFKKKLSLFN